MARPPSPGRLELRTWILPALQAILTGLATGLAVILVVLWRPKRVRVIPFYSDATHNDPERIILAIGENLACFLMPLVAIAEFLQQDRLAAGHARPVAPRILRCLVPAHRLSTRVVVRANFIVTAATTLFFFVTANVPSKFPYTPPHQFAASALILVYAVQATLKAVLANTFGNYELDATGDVEVGNGAEAVGARGGVPGEEGDAEGVTLIEPVRQARKQSRARAAVASWWGRHHMKIRLLLAGILWMSLLTTWLCFVGRGAAKRWGGAGRDAIRRWLSLAMAVIVHAATGSCLGLMAVMAVDMRHERVVIVGRGW